MLALELIRSEPDKVKDSLIKRGDNPKLVDDYLQAEAAWKQAAAEYEPLKAKQNQLSRGGKPAPAELKKATELKKKLEGQAKRIAELAAARQECWQKIPNLVDDDVPVGEGDSANTVIGQHGRIRVNQGRSHEALMIGSSLKNSSLDLKTAAQFSGSRFRYLLGSAAKAHLKLLDDAYGRAVKAGFLPIIPPVLTRAETMTRAGFFPFLKDDIFKLEGQDLYLTGTSEQTLLMLAADQVIDEDQLPLRLVGYSTCFRKEVGSYGKDVEGMFRQHQFDKVELVSVTLPEQSAAEHSSLVQLEQRFVEAYDLPYQLVMIGSGDLGPTAAKKIDLETWFPGQQRYRETHSASNCTDYQARRLNIKVRRRDGRIELACTLNATLATERLLLALIENNQRPDGSYQLPRRLR